MQSIAPAHGRRGGGVTLADVAQAAGVSTSTASRALTRPEMISREVVERVRRLADQLGYTANPFARSLRVQHSKTLGLIVPDSTNPFFAEVTRGIEAACFREGYTLILSNSDRSLEKEAAQARVLAETGVDGVLLFSASDASDATIGWLQGKGLPVVLVERRSPGMPVDCVISDNRGGVREAIEHLAGHGHRRIACLAVDLGASHYAERVAAYRETLTTLLLDADDRLLCADLVSYADGYSAARALLTRSQPPTALFCTTDTLAIGALRGAVSLGRRVPDDVAVVGYGNTEVTAFTNPPLTTVGQQRLAVGARAVRVLVQRLKEGSAELREQPRAYVVPTQLVVRESTGGIGEAPAGTRQTSSGIAAARGREQPYVQEEGEK